MGRKCSMKEMSSLEDLDIPDRIFQLRDFRLSPPCKCDLRSFGISRRAEWQFLNRVSGKLIVPSAFQENLSSHLQGPSSEFGTNSLSRTIGNKLPLYVA